ncbi:extracellular solute-binding protein [Paenibacillus sp. HN-1]|uniref:extracellular solute-binding protein n=1 Tax=Paenibacillus TaxID=44249 RepID=UPI001CA7EA46|nr:MULTISPECIES: extracellular solute-binding protein [Paenibacillus]MBY9081399.1 extracellular solute-binding protein [Paenibacillus sp. CGMCC 1.18879]MBY9084919.1 extracellular solute-binding protein [Paenibacillus sinensis]
MTIQTRKRMSMLLTSALALSLVAGCGGNNGSASNGNSPGTAAPAGDTKTASSSGIDTSKKVELQFYMLGDAPKDLSVIEAEVNKMAEKDLNATVKFNYTTWTDWDQKYKLLLSTGQSIDLIFTADWTQYQAYAKKGAFLALDDLLPKAAPELQKFVPQDMWDAVKVDGKIYTVPATYKEYVTGGFVYREDLRKKYNLPVPKDLETFEAYLAGIKANEPDMLPMSLNSDIRALHYAWAELHGQVYSGVPYGVGIKYDDPTNAYSYWGSPEHLEELKLMKSWQDKGYIPKNVLNIKDTLNDPVIAGKAASMIGDNPNRFNETNQKMKSAHPDWELGYTPYAGVTGFATPVHPIHNGFAIPKNSKNPERALAFYEKLVTDKRYNQLTEYGIEGKNYSVDNGYYKMIGTVDTNGFPREGMNGWAWRNPEYMLFEPSYDNVKKIFDELDKVQKPDLFLGFAEDYTSYQAEKAALEQVEKQYLYPLQAGLVDDVQKGLDTFMQKAKQAGLEKIQTEYIKQWKAYCAEKNIK